MPVSIQHERMLWASMTQRQLSTRLKRITKSEKREARKFSANCGKRKGRFSNRRVYQPLADIRVQGLHALS